MLNVWLTLRTRRCNVRGPTDSGPESGSSLPISVSPAIVAVVGRRRAVPPPPVVAVPALRAGVHRGGGGRDVS